jgi:homocysteine S-methyltransferase
MTIEEGGNSLDGTAPEQFAPALQAFGADVIGLNCSVGPAQMLETIERIGALTGAALSAQPNAGQPRDVEGRTIYLTSPEYMASYARRFVQRGVRLVGGCCGTTPDHIRLMKTAVARASAQSRGAGPARREAGRATAAAVGAPPPLPLEPVLPDAASAAAIVPRPEKSFLAHALAHGRFVTMVELTPPKGHDTEAVLQMTRTLRIGGVDVVHIADHSRGPRMSPLALAVLIQQRTGIETVLQYSCRDRNLLGMQSDLLGAHAMGLRNLLVVTGDVHPVGDYPDASAVFDVDSIGLVNVIARLNRGLDIGGQPIGAPSAFHVGVAVNPAAEDLEAEIRRFEYKVEAGAEFAVTRPVFDVEAFDRLHRRIEAARLPIVLGLWPLHSVLEAEFMANELPGMRIPEPVLARIRRAEGAAAAEAEGIAIARDLGNALRDRVHGVLVSAPPGRMDPALKVLDAMR